MNTLKTHERMLNSLFRQTMSRRQMLATAGVAIGGTALTTATPMAVSAQMMDEDAPFDSAVDVLNYALTLEHLETAFYRDGLAMIGAGGITALGFQESVYDNLVVIGEHEATHVEVLADVIGQLGGEPVAEATYDFGYSDAQGFLAVALALEDTGVSAYQGAAQYLIGEDALLTAALTIHGVEARHAAYVALLNGAVPYPEAFNPTLTPDEVLEIAGSLIVAEG